MLSNQTDMCILLYHLKLDMTEIHLKWYHRQLYERSVMRLQSDSSEEDNPGHDSVSSFY